MCLMAGCPICGNAFYPGAWDPDCGRDEHIIITTDSKIAVYDPTMEAPDERS